MAISIDYSNPAQFIINIPKADTTFVTATPSEVRELSVQTLHTALQDLQDDASGVWAPTAFFSVAPIPIGSITLARVLEILDPYVIQFEDGMYGVEVTGGNSNISDVLLRNQVGVNTANSAGLTEPPSAGSGSFVSNISMT